MCKLLLLISYITCKSWRLLPKFFYTFFLSPWIEVWLELGYNQQTIPIQAHSSKGQLLRSPNHNGDLASPLKPQQRLLTRHGQPLTAAHLWSQVSSSAPTSSSWATGPRGSTSRSLCAKMQRTPCRLPTWSWAWPPFSAVLTGEWTRHHRILLSESLVRLSCRGGHSHCVNGCEFQ